MQHRRTPLLAFALSVVMLAGCAPGRDLPVLSAPAEAGYRLGPGDQVRIITVGDEALTGEFRVGDSGRICAADAGQRARRRPAPGGTGNSALRGRWWARGWSVIHPSRSR